MRDFFTRFASGTSQIVGSHWSFLIAILVVLAWAVTGPLFRFSDTWQLIINTGTTIVTFLMVFLIQNTQNRDARAMHLKLDELISAVKTARNEMIDIEHLSDAELERIAKRYQEMREAYADDVEAVAEDAAREVAEDTAKRVVEDEKTAA